MLLSMCTAAHLGMLQYNELCTPWHICLFCFSAIFSNYICCWIYSRYSQALFSQVRLTACQGAKTGAKCIGWDLNPDILTARLGVFAFPRWLCTWSIYTQKKFCCHIKKNKWEKNRPASVGLPAWSEQSNNVPGKARGVLESSYSGFHTVALVGKHDSERSAELIWINRNREDEWEETDSR